MSLFHFTSSPQTIKECQCGLVHVLREPPIRVLPDPVASNDAVFDYERQAWVVDGKYIRCAHPGDTCDCYGRLHEGESALPGKTIWNSDGTDGPCLICMPPVSDS